MADQTKGGRGGLRLGKYEVTGHIATGGMGAVYKAVDTELNRPVALKILAPELAVKPANVERFRREARSAQKLRHDNIVAIYEFGEAGGTHFLAMEFVDGIDLHEYINLHGPLNPDQARHVLVQAARALDHAHRQGIVHRDIKPSNFLIADKDGKLLVKLTDLGLARQIREDEYRVTRLGTTVGTVDYMSPEQAKNSGTADIRSDLYSLGCTLYHMLSGAAPFPEGGIGERVFKHVETEAPDIRQTNPDVPEDLVAVLQKLLQKKPVDRYQTPLELLKDLESPENLKAYISQAEGLSRLAKLAQDETAVQSKPPRRASGAADSKGHELVIPPAKRPRRLRDTSAQNAAPGDSTTPWPAVVIALLALVVIGIGVWSQMGPRDKRPQPPPGDEQVVQNNPPTVEPPAPEEKDPNKQTEPAEKSPVEKDPEKKQTPAKKIQPPPIRKVDAEAMRAAMGPEPPEYRALLKPLDRDDLWQEFRGPFQQFPEAPADAPMFRVGRTLPDGGSTFQTLADALEQRRGDRPIIIEIHDNGPLFCGSLAELTKARVWIRAGVGYRPLLAWDPSPQASHLADKTSPTPPRFVSLLEGQLVLEDLDIVTKWSEPASAESPCLFALQGSELQARRCTFSLAGKHPQGLVAARLTGRGRDSMPSRVRLSRCYVRGGDATALQVAGCPAEVLLERCLVVSTDRPLLRLQPGENQTITVRLVRSTLVAGKTAVEAVPPGLTAGVSCLCWDTLLARSDPRGEGEMIRVPAGANLDGFNWRAVNCVFAGWRQLLNGGGKSFSAQNLEEWTGRWVDQEGIRALDDAWPPAPPFEPEELAASLYATHDSALAFAASSGPGRLGCELGAIPPGPVHWLRRTFERYAVAPPALAEGDPPPIPTSSDGLYHGERVDLSHVDLGELLQTRLSARPGPRVVLHLTGKGEHPLSPLRLRGYKHLVLYFEPPENDKTPSLTLVPAPDTADRDALIDVQEGIVELIGARIMFRNDRFAAMPRHMLRVSKGELRLARCHLQGPLTQPPPTFQGLVACAQTQDAKQPVGVSIHESILLGTPRLLSVRGGEARLRVKQSVLVAPAGVLHLDLGPRPAERTPFFGLIERNTIAVSGPVVRVSDPAGETAPREPAVLQVHANFFVNPFTEASRPAALLQCPTHVLSRGELLWQGSGNAFDQRRLQAFAKLEDDDEARVYNLARWRRLWGQVGESKSLLVDVPATAKWTFRADTPRLERVVLPPGVRPAIGAPVPGADLVRLGILKKS